MRELDIGQTEHVSGSGVLAGQALKKLGKKAAKEGAKYYWNERDNIANRAKKNWGTKEKIDHYNKRNKEAKGRSRVICTHFYQKGMIERNIWRADLEFTQQNLSATTVRGYHYWAIPYVELMRNHSFFEKIMLPIAKYRAIELAYQMNVLDKGSIRGKLIRAIFEPACFVIGSFCEQKDWQRLWVNQ
ncbi:hypothetical protein [Vibrio sp. M260112]|uniref:hypothetical protein n=1 Tax=Vibrio sp. M260112 TaxID=3020895 RepID=UPI002F3E42E3